MRTIFQLAVLLWISIASRTMAEPWEDFKHTNFDLMHREKEGTVDTGTGYLAGLSRRLCRMAEYKQFPETQEEIRKHQASLEWAWLATECIGHPIDETVTVTYLGKAIYGGSYAFSHFNGFLDWFGKQSPEKRAVVFSAILHGGATGTQTFLETTIRAIEKNDGRRNNLMDVARLTCNIIQNLYPDTLGFYLYDPVKGCSHPVLEFTVRDKR